MEIDEDLNYDRDHREILERITAAPDITTIIIARTPFTIKNADRIAIIANGRVKDIGTHNDLMKKPGGGWYQTMMKSQILHDSDLKSQPLAYEGKIEEEDEEDDELLDIHEEIDKEETKSYSRNVARSMAYPHAAYLFLGVVGAVLSGGIFPAWGVVCGFMVSLIFQQIHPCPVPEEEIGEDHPLFGFSNCYDYYEHFANTMRQTSFQLAIYWALIALACLVGNLLLSWAFGLAKERLNRRVRDSAFKAMIRQEMAYFDQRTVSTISKYLQDDVTRINAFSNDALRVMFFGLCSQVLGFVLSVKFMWPVALMSLATFPVTWYGTHFETRHFFGDEGYKNAKRMNSSSKIVAATLLHFREVSILCMQKQQYETFGSALLREPYLFHTALKSSAFNSSVVLLPQLNLGFQFWWGGWLLFFYGHKFSLENFLVSFFVFLFSSYSLGSSGTRDVHLRECEKSAGRIFYLLKRKSSIDPMDEKEKSLKEDTSYRKSVL